ncbi:MAG: hypothetical protein K1Y36_02715 [Blastocatellia bacterium]|nr:hypothetical protein [Blastocatellia bacterium]
MGNTAFRIVSANRQSWVEVEPVAVESSHLPGIQVRIGVSDEGFGGYHPEIWLEAEPLMCFVSQLANVVKGSGQVILISMSPNEFLLTISKSSHQQSFKIAYELTRTSYHSGQVLTSKSVKGEFELDHEFQNILLQDFSTLTRLLADKDTYEIWRQDDHGHQYLMKTVVSRANAIREVEHFESLGHKQSYWFQKSGQS